MHLGLIYWRICYEFIWIPFRIKKCIYVKIIYDSEKLEKPKIDILTKIFESYTCEDLKDPALYLEKLYNTIFTKYVIIDIE